MSTCLLAFVACPPGVEPTLAGELEQLGLIGKVTTGGALVRCELPTVRWLLQRSRVAQSVRVRLKAFRAENFGQLERGLARLPWHAYFGAGARPEFRVVCHRSRLFHSGAVQERAARAFERAWRGGSSESENLRQQRVHVRVERDWVQVSVDASGPLYRRGYRTHVTEASLRETLAAVAARLLLQRAPEVTRVWDPFCGSGVLPLEWELSRRATPAHLGPFPMDAWPIARGLTQAPLAAADQQRASAHVVPSTDNGVPASGAPSSVDGDGVIGGASLAGASGESGLWLSDVNSRALGREHPVDGDGVIGGASLAGAGGEPVLWLSDVNARALAAARQNAANADLLERCRLLALDFDQAAAHVPAGTAILCNPPYGVRLGSEARARRTLRRFEQRLRERIDLRPALVLCPCSALGDRHELPWQELARFPNGGLQISAHWLPRD